MEKVIYTRLYQHINQNNILATEQYGFRNNSTEKASFKLINEILLALNNKLTVGGIFCDLEKTFNNINNITDNINDWFRDNSLAFNFDKTYFLKFRPKKSYKIHIKISCDTKLIKETKNTNFLD